MRKKFGIFLGEWLLESTTPLWKGRERWDWSQKEHFLPIILSPERIREQQPPWGFGTGRVLCAHYSPGAPLQLRCVGLKFIM